MSETTNWIKKLAKKHVSVASAIENKPQTQIQLPSPSLTWATSGGIRRGKVCMYYGPESAGKTMLAMMTVISDQVANPDGIWIWFNAEFSFDRDRFAALGGDCERLLVVSSNDPIQIFDYFYTDIDAACKDGAPIVGAVIDSIHAIAFPKDIKTESTKLTMGGTGASYLPGPIKRWSATAYKYNITTIVIQQVQLNVDPYASEKYTIPDGKALCHWCDYQILTEKVESKAGKIFGGMKTMAGNDIQIGHVISCRMKKARLGIPNRIARMKFHYNQGIVDQVEEVYELAKSLGLVKHPEGKGNAYWQCLDGEIFYGEKKIIEKFKEDVELQNKVWEMCLAYTDDISTNDEEETKRGDDKE